MQKKEFYIYELNYIPAITEKRFIYNDYVCVILMQDMCHRCGYVKIPKDHPLYLTDMNLLHEVIRCYGGITYAEEFLFGQDDEECWWIGFDCNHFMDGKDFNKAKELFKDYPENLKYIKELEETYSRHQFKNEPVTLEFCEETCKAIVNQIF